MIGRKRHHGLTLIEVLAAAVLLAMLSAACIPLLRSVRINVGVNESPVLTFDEHDLEQFADVALVDPAHDDLRAASGSIDLTLAWPHEPSRPAVRVRNVDFESSQTEPTHRWLVFACEQVSVWRCVDLPRGKQNR